MLENPSPGEERLLGLVARLERGEALAAAELKWAKEALEEAVARLDSEAYADELRAHYRKLHPEGSLKFPLPNGGEQQITVNAYAALRILQSKDRFEVLLKRLNLSSKPRP